MRPGVYVDEAPLPRVIEPSNVGLSAGAFIGTALKGGSDPVLLTSWSQFVSQYGSFSADDRRTSLAPAVYQFFANGGGACYVCRVLPSDALTAETALVDSNGDPAVSITASSPGYWGNGLSVDVIWPQDIGTTTKDPGNRLGPFDPMAFNVDFDRPMDYQPPLDRPDKTGVPYFDLVVRYASRGVAIVVERFTRLTMDQTDVRYIERIINESTAGSQYIRAEDLHRQIDDDFSNNQPYLIPVPVERQSLMDGSDGKSAVVSADYSAAVERFELIEGNLLFNVPGIFEVSNVADAVEKRGDSFLIVDAPNMSVVQNVLGAGLPSSSYSAVYYPWLAIPDPDPSAARGAVRWVPPGGSVAGMVMRTDASRGSFKAPAGVGASLTGVVATSKRLTNAELDMLNNFQVNAIRPVMGSGITVMGARTRDFGTTARYISVRRTLNWIKEQARAASQFALFEPNTPVLWEQLRVANGSFLSELWQMGGLAGQTFDEGFYVKVDRDNNPPRAIANGEVHVEIGVAPVYPAEFIIIRLGQFEAEASFVVTEE